MRVWLCLVLLLSAGAALAEDSRAVILPTASTLPQGEVNLSLIQIVPSVSLGVTDDFEIGIGGTYLPLAEAIVGLGAKVRLATRGKLQVAAFGYAAVDLAPVGIPVYAPAGGLVLTFDLFDDKLRFNVNSLLVVPVTGLVVDAVMIVAPTASYAFTDWLYVAAELHGRVVVPYPQGGLTAYAAVGFKVAKLDAQIGWVIDFGIGGPPLPIVSETGIPMFALSWRL